MTNLPGHWCLTTVGEICSDLQYGYTASATNDPVGPRFLRITDIQDGHVQWDSVPFCEIGPDQIKKYSLHDGDIVFARTGGTVGKSYIIDCVPQTAVFASYLIRVSAAKGISPSFLYYFFQSASYWEQIGLKKGGLQGNVNATTLSSLLIPLAPFRQQERIVAKLEELFSELDKGVESLTVALEQLRAYRQSLLRYAFEGKLTADWRSANKENVEPINRLVTEIIEDAKHSHRADVQPLSDDILAALPAIPEQWSWGKLGWLASSVEYGTSAKSSKSGRIPVLRMGNLQDGTIDWSDLVFTDDEDDIRRYALRAGDVLFNRTNSPELVGKTSIYDGKRPAIFAGYLMRVNHKPAFVDSQCLSYFLNSPAARQHGNSVKTDGVNQSNINGEKLKQYPFPISSREEQEEIARRLKMLFEFSDTVMAEIQRGLERASILRQSILKKAFLGELVAHDGNDEPAPVLLERIRAERAGNHSNRRAKQSSRGEAA